MLARTQALEDRLLALNAERNELEAESARMPSHTTGRTLQVGWGGGGAPRRAGLLCARAAQCVRLLCAGTCREAERSTPSKPSTGCLHLALILCPSQERKRRAEVERRLEELTRECSSVRLQLRRLGVK